MSFIEQIKERAKSARKKIVLPEGQDPRVIEAARGIAAQEIATVLLIGSEEELDGQTGLDQAGIELIDHRRSELCEELAEAFQARRAHKGVTIEDAREQLKDRLYFGNMLVAKGLADGLVAGSIASTGAMLRAAFQCIGTADGIATGSSCFVMELKEPAPSGDDVLIFADCGVNPEPSPEQLCDIAIATAQTHKALVGTQPRVAFLSFSTKGSASHPLIDRTIAAVDITRKRIDSGDLDIVLDGELQGDSALVPSVAQAKCPDSPVGGSANILIFPDLQAGNIAYKLTQRLAGAAAYGPILQGLAKPVNDLSRGCSSDDIVGVSAITACQAQ